MEQIIAKERGLIKETNIFALLLDLQKQNDLRKQQGSSSMDLKILNRWLIPSYEPDIDRHAQSLADSGRQMVFQP